MTTALSDTGQFYRLLSDDEAVIWMQQRAGRTVREAEGVVYDLRHQARATYGLPGSVQLYAEVLPGCTFKDIVRQETDRFWNCGEIDLPNFNFDDPAINHCLVGWIPFPYAFSNNKIYLHQQLMLGEYNKNFPDWHQFSLGSLTHLSGLALARQQIMQRDPFQGVRVRTGTLSHPERPLELLFVGDRLKYNIGWRDASAYNLYIMPVAEIVAKV